MTVRGIFRWRVIRWPLLVLPVLLVAVLYPIDRAYKQTDIAGYIPEDAAWFIVSADAADCWAFLEASTEYAAFEDELSKPFIAFERETFLRTGIRPTPSRWQLWMGNALAISTREGAVGFSVRPGLLARGYHLVRSTLGAGTQSDVHRFADFHYRWHEGFLIASRDAAYLEGAWSPRAASEADSVDIAHTGGAAGSFALTIGADTGFPIRLTMDAPRGHATLSAEPIRQFPDGAIITVAAPSLDTLAPLWEAVSTLGMNSAFLARLLEGDATSKELSALPQLTDEEIDHLRRLTFAVYGLELDEPSFLPQGISVAETVGGVVHPASSLGPGHPFEWEGVPGELFDTVGAWGNIAIVSEGTTHYTVTGEPLMTQLMAEPLASQVASNAVEITIDWQGVAEELQRAARRLAKDDMESPLEYAVVEGEIMPVLRAIGELGRATITGDIDGDTLVLEGTLTSAHE